MESIGVLEDQSRRRWRDTFCTAQCRYADTQGLWPVVFGAARFNCSHNEHFRPRERVLCAVRWMTMKVSKTSHKPFPLLSSYHHLRRITVMSFCHLIRLPSCSVIHQLCGFLQHFLRTRRCISHSDQVPGPAGHSCWTCGVCTLQHFPKVNVGQALFSSIIRMSAGRSLDCSDVSCWCHRMKMKHCYNTPSPAPFFQPLFQRHEGNLKVRCYHILLSFSLISSP